MLCRKVSLLLIAFVTTCVLSKEDVICLSKEEISARLASEDRTKKRLTRVTNPGTASTQFRSSIAKVQGIGEYERYQSFDCDNLCFSPSKDDDPWVQLDFLPMNDGHHPFDRVLKLAAEGDNGDDDPYLMTTLRDPYDYAAKFYTTRVMWDEPSQHFTKDLSFEEFLEKVPWRANQLTRMLGREDDDKRVITKMIDPPTTDDEYMQEQNALGSQSTVLAKAWQRLSQELIWFGLFHRLRDSMELLAFTVCADADTLMEGYENQPPRTREDKLTKRNVGELSQEKKTELVKEIEKRNQLDAILMARAEALFDQRLKEMREAKQNEILCNFVNTVPVTCANDEDRDEL